MRRRWISLGACGVPCPVIQYRQIADMTLLPEGSFQEKEMGGLRRVEVACVPGRYGVW
jgi:hypothetical protein